MNVYISGGALSIIFFQVTSPRVRIIVCFSQRVIVALHTVTYNIVKTVTHLYWKPAESEYGDYDHNHPGHALLAPPTLGRRRLPTRVHALPQSHQHQHVQDADDSQRYRVRREKEKYLKHNATNVIV